MMSSLSALKLTENNVKPIRLILRKMDQLSLGTEQLLAIIDQILAAVFLRLKDNECNGISFR